MNVSKDVALRYDEKIAFSLRQLYSRYGYSQYRMSKFEEFELYADKKDYLGAKSILSFTDTNGKLMALKPDVTLSIIKSLKKKSGTQKVYYQENVYRVSKTSGSYREILQTGLECIGAVGDYERAEVLYLSLLSLESMGRPFRLDLSHMGLLAELIDDLYMSKAGRKELITCLSAKNAEGVRRICLDEGIDGDIADKLSEAASLYGSPEVVLPRLRRLLGITVVPYLEQLDELCAALTALGYEQNLGIDLSIVNDMSYYNGIVFRGYVEGMPDGVLSGGCYDLLMKKMGRDCSAIGFAVSLDEIERLEKTEHLYDYDVVLYTDPSVSHDKVLTYVSDFAGEGKSVRVVNDDSQVSAEHYYRVTDYGLISAAKEEGQE